MVKKQKYVSLLALGLGVSTILAACGGNGDTADSSATSSSTAGGAEDNFTVAMVTDIGGVDDKSFNQSAWEGLVAWAKRTAKKKGLMDTIISNQMPIRNL